MWRMIVMVLVVGFLAPGCAYIGFGDEESREGEDAKKTVVDQVEIPVQTDLKPRPKPPAPPLSPSLDPATLIGLNQAEVLAAFGEPKNRKDAAPAQVWQYAAGECEVELFFYLDLSDEQFHLLNYDTNQPNGGADAAQRCFDQVLGRRPQVN